MAFEFIPLWAIIVGIFLLVIIFLVRASNSINVLSFVRSNFFYFFLILLFAVVVISAINIAHTHNFDLSTPEGAGYVAKVYFNWFIGFLKNIGRVTGYAVQQDWFGATNSTVK